MALESLTFVSGILKNRTRDLLVNNQPTVPQATAHRIKLQNYGNPIGVETVVTFNVTGRTASLAGVPLRMPPAPAAASFNEVAITADGVGVLAVMRFPSSKNLAAGDVVVFNRLEVTLRNLMPEFTVTQVLNCSFKTDNPLAYFPDINDNPRNIGVLPRGDLGIAPYPEQYTTFANGQSAAPVSFGPLSFAFTVRNVSVGPNTRIFFDVYSPGFFVPAGARFVIDAIKLVD